MQIPENLLPLLLDAALHIGVAIVIFLVGRWIAAFTRSRLRPALQKTKLTESMVNLAVTLSFYSIWVATIVAGLAVLGFPVETLLTLSLIHIFMRSPWPRTRNREPVLTPGGIVTSTLRPSP